MTVRWNAAEIDLLNGLAIRIRRLEELAIAQAKVDAHTPGMGQAQDDMARLLEEIQKEQGSLSSVVNDEEVA